jgi:hypothetical protein
VSAAFDWTSAGAWLVLWLLVLAFVGAVIAAVSWWRAVRWRSPVEVVNDDLARRRQARDRVRRP